MTTIERTDGYAPLRHYGLLGDGHGCALACADGSVDWFAAPGVETPPLLAGLIDADRGGHVLLAPDCPSRITRRYLPGTMVLETIFETEHGSLVVTDALTMGFAGPLPWSELARRVRAVGGPVPVRYELSPGTRFATVRPWVHERDGVPLVLAGDLLAGLVLEGLGDPRVEQHRVAGEATLEPGHPGLLALVVAKDQPLRLPSPADVLNRLEHTEQTWRRWSSLIDYSGPHRDEVVRSALVLKALASTRTGAIAAAPTTSLPEVIGGSRNFDYRFAWVRDASFMLDAMARLGLSEEVDLSLAFLLQCVGRTAPDIHVFYEMGGAPAPGEQHELSELPGYRGSSPVIVGNKAASQTQHGAYGDLFGAVFRHVEHGSRIDTATGVMLAGLADRLCDEWTRPGSGIWELGEHRLYTSSLISAWSALDRAVRLAEQDQIARSHLERWRQAAEEIRRHVDEHCWSQAKGAYSFYEGTDKLDAAVLLAGRTGFLAGDDQRLWSTIDAVRRELTAEGPLLYRYTGAAEEEHAFVCCTFWLAEALSIAGRVEEAGELLDGALARANDLGLWSEEIDPGGGELLGNFPLGLSHLAVIGAITSYATARQKSGAS